MTFTDYVLDIVLIAIVIRQVRESRLDLRAVLLPVGICVFVCSHYLKALPTDGNDLLLIGGFAAVGVLCGAVSAAATRVRSDGGDHALIKAGWVAAGIWVASMGFRLGFAIWSSHGGSDDLTRFSIEHHITGGDAWTDALVLMAMGEVFVRTGLLVLRGRRVVAGRPATTTLVTV
jgi:hypothetical protein